MSRELVLYTAKGCQLCAQMQEELHALLIGLPVIYHIIDISDDLELQYRYGARIPVLVSGQQEICEVKLDKKALHDFISAGGCVP